MPVRLHGHMLYGLAHKFVVYVTLMTRSFNLDITLGYGDQQQIYRNVFEGLVCCQ